MHPSPNIFYYLALFAIWPLMAYKIYKRYPLDKSIILLLLVPYLFLPVAHPSLAPLKLPLLPPLDKEVIPILVALWLVYINKIKIEYLPRFQISLFFCLALLFSPILTVLTNRDPLAFPTRVIPGLKLTEALSTFVGVYLKVYVPFVMGYSLLRSDKAHEEFIKCIFILGLIYAVLMAYEIRMSPQLHTKIYGYFPHEWIQQRRAGGFRPVVFLGHGLLVALYGVWMTIAAYVLWRERHSLVKGKGAWVFLFFCVILVLCKTYSAVIYFFIFAALTIFFSVKMRLNAAAVIALLLMLFPAVRAFLPLSEIVGFFEGLNPERAGSLQFRINNEDLLLQKANERPLFGWGTWGRNRIYNPETGKDISVTDGTWIIIYGMFGWLGYIGVFGILTYPILAYRKVFLAQQSDKTNSPYTIALIIILTIVTIDQIPNASLNGVVYLMAGAILGRARQLAASEPSAASDNQAQL
mgnify:CR=1 FL=1|jgi:hypothetical protein